MKWFDATRLLVVRINIIHVQSNIVVLKTSLDSAKSAFLSETNSAK